jgi:Flp pilus assembly pilin Flp
MWHRISKTPLTVYLAVAGFIQTLKRDERGLSGVVVAILLILVAVLAIVMIWLLLGDWLQELWEQITGEAESIS